jgi:CRP-like cAMP-binding protein
MKSNSNNHISIAEQIIEGSISIRSIEEFRSIIKIFPNDPALQKAYSDLLLKKNRPDEAAQSYSRAAQLFIDAGKILQAIDSKLLHWNIKPPSPKEAQLFYSALHAGTYYETPLKTFFQRLSYREMVAFITKLVRVRVSSGNVVKKTGEQEKDLFFIVSGSLKETAFLPLRQKDDTLYRKRSSFLNESHFFGDIYPFKDQATSKSYIEANLPSELVRITKSNLIKICKEFPNIERALIDLYKVRKGSDNGDSQLQVRRLGRHQLPLKINLHLFTDAYQKEPLILDGYSRDLSIGGLCVILDGKYNSISSIYKNVKIAKIEMSLPKQELSLKVSGDIVWSREFSWKNKKIVALGFQFTEMAPKFRGLFFMMADGICYNELKRK